MGRLRVIPLIILLFSPAVVGCQSLGPIASWGWNGADNGRRLAKKTDDPFVNPSRQNDRTSQKILSAQKTSPQKTSHSTEIQTHIDHELRDATLQERKTMLAALENKNPTIVKLILRQRRLALMTQQDRERTAAGTGREPQRAGMLGGHSSGSPNFQGNRLNEEHRLGEHESRFNRPLQVDPKLSSPIRHVSDNRFANHDPLNHDPNRWQPPPVAPQIIPQSFTENPPTTGNTTASGGTTAASDPTKIPPMPTAWEEELDRLIAMTDSLAASGTMGGTAQQRYDYLRKQVYLRMLFLISKKPQQSMDAIAGIDAADQEFWKDTFFALSSYLDPAFAGNAQSRATRTIRPLRTAVQRLQETADLDIQQLVFCQKITNFGNYDPFSQNEFREGDPVLIYAEIANFKTMPIATGQFQTRLRSKIEIYKVGVNGRQQVKVFDFPPTNDVCRNRRRDYFHSYEIEIPKQVGAGPYILQLTVTDEQGQKIATDVINFTIKP